MLKVFSLKNQKKDSAGNDPNNPNDAKNQQQKKLSAAQIRITKGLIVFPPPSNLKSTKFF